MSSTDDIREMVRGHYAEAARRVTARGSSCCGPTAPTDDPITGGIYTPAEVEELPEDAVSASLGCGNPTALADLRAGETVLDLGSGGGIDVLLSARRVGPTGKAYGLDMTDEMLELARRNQRQAGVDNAEFLKGTIEDIPLPDESVDVIISNCVINLSPDKDRVLREAHRVLRPGGRLAITDVVLRRALPAAARRSLELWAGCIAGALLEDDYRSKLAAAGFGDLIIEPVRIDTRRDAAAALGSGSGCGGDAETSVAADTLRAERGFTPDELDGALMSAFVRARKAG